MVVYVLKAWGIVIVQLLHMKTAKALLPVVFYYDTHIAFALAAVRSLSIPVYHVLKRLALVMVLLGEWLMGGSTPGKEISRDQFVPLNFTLGHLKQGRSKISLQK